MPRVKSTPLNARTPVATSLTVTPGDVQIGARLTWGTVQAREFLRYPGGGCAIPEEDPATIDWVLGMYDAVPVRDESTGDMVDAVRLPPVIRRPDTEIRIPRSAVKGAKAAAQGSSATKASPTAQSNGSRAHNKFGTPTEAEQKQARGLTHAERHELHEMAEHARSSKSHSHDHAGAPVMSDVPHTHVHSNSKSGHHSASTAALEDTNAATMLQASVPPMSSVIQESHGSASGGPSLAGVLQLGSVDDVERWKRGVEEERRRQQAARLKAIKKKKKMSLGAHRMLAAASAGYPIPLFRPLTVEERKHLFKRDALESFADMDALSEANDEMTAVAREMVQGRRESKIGCRCAVLSATDIEGLPIKKLKMQLRDLGLSTDGSRKQLILRVVEFSRKNTGCMKLKIAEIPEVGQTLDPSTNFEVDAHEACIGISHHITATQPLDECHKAALALHDAEQTDFQHSLSSTESTSQASSQPYHTQLPESQSQGKENSAAESATSPRDEGCPCIASGSGCHWGICSCCQECCTNRPLGDPASTVADGEAQVYRQMLLALLESRPKSALYLEPELVTETWKDLREAESDEDDDDDEEYDGEIPEELLELAPSLRELAEGGVAVNWGDSDSDEEVPRKNARKQQEESSDSGEAEDIVEGSGAQADALLANVLAATSGQKRKRKGGKAAPVEPAAKRNRSSDVPGKEKNAPAKDADVSAFRFDFDSTDRYLVNATEGDKTPGPGVQ